MKSLRGCLFYIKGAQLFMEPSWMVYSLGPSWTQFDVLQKVLKGMHVESFKLSSPRTNRRMLETKSKPKHPIMTWGVNRLHHRCWSALERHWNGTQLHTLDTAVRWAKSMTWNALSPIVGVATKLYANGVKLTKKAFAKLASRLQRTAGVEWWSVRIVPHPCIQ